MEKSGRPTSFETKALDLLTCLTHQDTESSIPKHKTERGKGPKTFAPVRTERRSHGAAVCLLLTRFRSGLLLLLLAACGALLLVLASDCREHQRNQRRRQQSPNHHLPPFNNGPDLAATLLVHVAESSDWVVAPATGTIQPLRTSALCAALSQHVSSWQRPERHALHAHYQAVALC